MLSKNFQSKLQKLMEVEMKSKEMTQKVRNLFPEAQKVVYSIDYDKGNERVYYDFHAILNKNDNELLSHQSEEDSDEVFALLEELNTFIWDVASFDDTLHEQQFSFDFDTFEVTIIKFFRGKQIKPLDNFNGFWKVERVRRPWWFHYLPEGYYEMDGKIFGIEDLEYPNQNLLFPFDEDSELKHVTKKEQKEYEEREASRKTRQLTEEEINNLNIRKD